MKRVNDVPHPTSAVIAPWKDLPADIISEHILSNLNLVDHANCEAVCTDWHKKLQDNHTGVFSASALLKFGRNYFYRNHRLSNNTVRAALEKGIEISSALALCKHAKDNSIISRVPGEILYSLGKDADDDETAILFLKNAQNDDGEANFHIADRYYILANYKKALKYYERAIPDLEDFLLSSACFNAGKICLKFGLYEEALEIFEQFDEEVFNEETFSEKSKAKLIAKRTFQAVTVDTAYSVMALTEKLKANCKDKPRYDKTRSRRLNKFAENLCKNAFSNMGSLLGRVSRLATSYS